MVIEDRKVVNTGGQSQAWQQGVDYVIRSLWRASGIAIIAPHGGEIEPGTSEIAEALADDDYSLYCFNGIRKNDNRDLHIPSVLFDEKACEGLINQSRLVVAIHGCSGGEKRVYVGGRAVVLKGEIIRALIQAGFQAIEDTSRHSGYHPNNLCNRPESGAGLQLEISRGLRRSFFKGLGQEGRQVTTPKFDLFIKTVRQVLKKLNLPD